MPNLTPPPQWAAAGGASGAVADSWLASFHEPPLDALVMEAIAFNPDLRIAAARVDTAAAYLAAAKSPLWPQVNLVARGGGKMSGDSSGLEGVGLFASWELDLWGRVRAVTRATELQYQSDGARRRVRAAIDRSAGGQELDRGRGSATAEGAGGSDAEVVRAARSTCAGSPAHRQRRRIRRRAGPGQRRKPARHGAQPRPGLRQRTARTRDTGRALPRRHGRGGRNPARLAWRRSGRTSLRAPRATSRCRRGGAPCRRGVLSHRGGESRPPAAHHAGRQLHVDFIRALRAA